VLDAIGAWPPHRRVDSKSKVEYEPLLWGSGVVTRPPVSPAAGSPDGAVWPMGDGAGAGADGSAPVESGGGWVVPLVVLVAGMFMSVLDISIVNVAIPTIQNNGVIDHEASVMLILFYPQSLAGDVNKKIDEIRALYNKRL